MRLVYVFGLLWTFCCHAYITSSHPPFQNEHGCEACPPLCDCYYTYVTVTDLVPGDKSKTCQDFLSLNLRHINCFRCLKISTKALGTAIVYNTKALDWILSSRSRLRTVTRRPFFRGKRHCGSQKTQNCTRQNIRNCNKPSERRRKLCNMCEEMIEMIRPGTTATESYSASNLARFGRVTQYQTPRVFDRFHSVCFLETRCKTQAKQGIVRFEDYYIATVVIG